MALLEIEDLSVRYTPKYAPALQAVREVSFGIEPGEFVGLVGESGSGKSTLASAILRLLQKPAHRTGGSVRFDGTDLSELSDEELRRVRWVDLSTVFQSSMNSLNPVITVTSQFEDTFAAHGVQGGEERFAELLRMVELDPEVLGRFPHELSGGMKQRVAIALALALEPRFVLLDEPTTGLDVLVQRRILTRLRELQAEFGFAVLFISHDIGMVLEYASRVLVMYRGEIVEDGESERVLRAPKDDYTKRLLASYDASQAPAPAAAAAPDAAVRPILEVADARKSYHSRRNRKRVSTTALDGVSIGLREGRVTALVGQSGSGKSTLARLLLGMERPDSGEVIYRDGERELRVDRARGRDLREVRRHVQMVFQDPYSSLNPANSVAYALSRPLRNYGAASGSDVRRRSLELLERVGLTPAESFIDKLPSQLSGGQRQRVVIARALAAEPRVLVADEPVSSLDVSIRASILELLSDLVRDSGLAMLYITHDLLSARAIADEVAVLHRGVIVEHGPTLSVTDDPQDAYTRELLAAIPNPFAEK